MRKPGGYAFLFDENGIMKEADTTTCGHCNKITHIKPMMDPADMGGLCKCCMRLICACCVGQPCDVIEKKLERAEASYHARRSYGI